MTVKELAPVAMPGKPRTRYSTAFKAQVLAECRADVSTASVALAHGLNANLVWKWRNAAQQARLAAKQPGFIPVIASHPATDSAAQAHAIEVAVRLAGKQIDIRWPVSEAGACAAWLREWLR